MDIYITVAPIVVIEREIQADYTKLDNTQTGCDVDCYSFSFKIKYDGHDPFRNWFPISCRPDGWQGGTLNFQI